MHRSLIIDSKISIGPVAEITFKGWPENKAKKIPQIEPAKMHSIVAFSGKLTINMKKLKLNLKNIYHIIICFLTQHTSKSNK